MKPRCNILVELLATDLISATSVRGPKDEDILKYIKAMGWELADPIPNETEVHILLGNDYFWSVQNGMTKK